MARELVADPRSEDLDAAVVPVIHGRSGEGKDETTLVEY